MKTIIFAIAFLTSVAAIAQDSVEDSAKEKSSKIYYTQGGNGALLSFSQVTRNGKEVGSIPRFTLFFNLGTNANLDLGNHFGVFGGLNLTNIGMITEEEIVGTVKTDKFKTKQRVYAVGIPVGIKIGDLRNFYVYGGAEAGFAINYKQKDFINGEKVDKFNEWFSNRTNAFMPAVFVGFQAKNGFGLKVQYYLNDFLNQGFSEGGVKPYAGTESQIFFLTLGYNFNKK
ncbi:hypothetical protein [Runella salmonicolor]|uniref:Outer membrane protein beta-barrel domain-containing protein n=1 Tax=Runella salmonicolor TaxID=2950278 RepID=A0ABT1FIX6_9BACT|nr:hypothetical protein [Runella salmonicolor]MCP1381720.1 hypothetical protein [Runella salmonicolor]